MDADDIVLYNNELINRSKGSSFTTHKERVDEWVRFFEIIGGLVKINQSSSFQGTVPPGEPGKDAASSPELIREAFLLLSSTPFIQEGREYDVDSDIITFLLPSEKFVLFCLIAYELSPDFSSAIREITGGSDYLNLSMIQELSGCCLTREEFRTEQLLDPDSLLNTFLVYKKGEMKGSLTLRRGILSYLMGAGYSPGIASECFELIKYDREDIAGKIISGDDEIDKILSILSNSGGSHEPLVICLEGMAGVGKKFIAGVCASVSNMGLLAVNMDKLLAHQDKDAGEYIRRMITKCILEGYFLYLGMGKASMGDIPGCIRAVSMVQDFMDIVFTGSPEPLKEELQLKGNVYSIPVKPPVRSLQKDFWRYFAGEFGLGFGSDIDLNELVSTYDMTPGRIRAVLNVLRSYGNEVIGRAELISEIKSICMVSFTNFAKRLSTNFTFEDLELLPDSLEKLKSAINRVRLKTVVNEGFGFGDKLPYGRGIVIALYGPPGTGKTMAANVVANELGMDIYRIDLSQVGSKYIGETEKNIASIFDTARNSNGILFFDEADALFGKRTDVSNSNDRHANAETAFLLQQIESYDGVSILATNVMQNMDYAFRRRITYIINIHNPDEEARKNIWNHVFPASAPLAGDVDLDKYARIELSGSNIKAAAISAAYMAAARGDSINHRDIVAAIDEEYRKLGHTGSVAGKMY